MTLSGKIPPRVSASDSFSVCGNPSSIHPRAMQSSWSMRFLMIWTMMSSGTTFVVSR